MQYTDLATGRRYVVDKTENWGVGIPKKYKWAVVVYRPGRKLPCAYYLHKTKKAAIADAAGYGEVQQ